VVVVVVVVVMLVEASTVIIIKIIMILPYRRNIAHVEFKKCEARNNRGNWNHLKII
jgi:hypothetical protein